MIALLLVVFIAVMVPMSGLSHRNLGRTGAGLPDLWQTIGWSDFKVLAGPGGKGHFPACFLPRFDMPNLLFEVRPRTDVASTFPQYVLSMSNKTVSVGSKMLEPKLVNSPPVSLVSLVCWILVVGVLACMAYAIVDLSRTNSTLKYQIRLLFQKTNGLEEANASLKNSLKSLEYLNSQLGFEKDKLAIESKESLCKATEEYRILAESRETEIDQVIQQEVDKQKLRSQEWEAEQVAYIEKMGKLNTLCNEKDTRIEALTKALADAQNESRVQSWTNTSAMADILKESKMHQETARRMSTRNQELEQRLRVLQAPPPSPPPPPPPPAPQPAASKLSATAPDFQPSMGH
ncbi:MAG: hypothetical protein Q9190_003860 [Brigantiaea leucoxantha]